MTRYTRSDRQGCHCVAIDLANDVLDPSEQEQRFMSQWSDPVIELLAAASIDPPEFYFTRIRT